ncbi:MULTISPECIES: glycosyltransferase family 4 protein [unclassified Polaribacter]|uniref:glycosyltransferase family 4 protein n=1 Tax=unclassified Polaribacter TaxID=196858 RepID=UPI001C4F8A55|nr:MULTISPECIES: glycosyltransferase family 4 protein [unclassified Polaribacter]QXP63389.1 glycosyltransferase family 4 protein [Polaribacter sp. HaHaR_3_91]QXP65896.1 glycosyltransferase family 4 protein [Polaribacter sp. AHE13PA]
MKPILIHTHFHKRRTGVTRSIENVLPFFNKEYETYVYGYNVEGDKITTSKLKKLLFSDREVVVHCHRNNEIMRMLFLRFLGAKFKLIATRHAETTPSGLTLKLLKKADKVVTLIESMSENLGIKNTIVGHGVNVDLFSPKKDVALENIQQENVILCAGRVRKAKGQVVLLEAAKVLKEHKNWALVIVGKIDKPAFLEELKKIAKKHHIADQIYFVGETSDIVSYYQASKIAVVPSFSEGFSLVTAEAMSCGCSVIATKNVGVHSSLIDNQKNGYLFEAGATSELETLLSKSLKNEIPLLGKEAREEILKNWSAKKEAENLMAVYKTT